MNPQPEPSAGPPSRPAAPAPAPARSSASWSQAAAVGVLVCVSVCLSLLPKRAPSAGVGARASEPAAALARAAPEIPRTASPAPGAIEPAAWPREPSAAPPAADEPEYAPADLAELGGVDGLDLATSADGMGAVDSALVPLEPRRLESAEAAAARPSRPKYPGLAVAPSRSGFTSVTVGPDGRRWLSVAHGAAVGGFIAGARPGTGVIGRRAGLALAASGGPAPANCPQCGLDPHQGAIVGGAPTRLLRLKAKGRCENGYTYEIVNVSQRPLGPMMFASDSHEAWDVQGLAPGQSVVLRSDTPLPALHGMFTGAAR